MLSGDVPDIVFVEANARDRDRRSTADQAVAFKPYAARRHDLVDLPLRYDPLPKRARNPAVEHFLMATIRR